MEQSLVNNLVKVILKKKNKKAEDKYYEIIQQFQEEQQPHEPFKVEANWQSSFHQYSQRKQNPYPYQPYTPYNPENKFSNPYNKPQPKWNITKRFSGSNGNLGFIVQRDDWGNNKKGTDWINQQERRNRKDIIFNPGQFKKIHHDTIQNEQVIYIEPSQAERKLQDLRKIGLSFHDNDFPPNEQSLTGPYGHIADWQPIKWKKISAAIQNSKIFQGKVQPSDIKQGFLGDCYFLAGLAALAQRPDRIFNLFLLRTKNELNYYSVKMIYRGKWRTIDLDEQVPFVFGEPAFSKSNQSQLWVILLQKAWAKMYGCYKQIEAGFPEEPLHDLTGAPIKSIFLKRKNINIEQTWKYLIKASQLEYSMVASSNPGSDTNKSQSGVVQGHAYTFLNATYLNVGSQSIKMVQLRNPWGLGEFKGRWSDYDKGWNYVSAQQKKRLKFDPNVKDGIFFMTFDDFRSQFRTLTIAQINDNASYVYNSYHDPESKGVYFRIQILQPGSYCFHIDKTPQRSYTGEAQRQYRYPAAWLDLGKIQNGHTKRFQGFVSRRRTLFKSYDLMPGTYVAFAKIDFDKKFQKDFEVTLAIYSEFACGIHIASKLDAIEFSGNSQIDWNNNYPQMVRKSSEHFGKCCSFHQIHERGFAKLQNILEDNRQKNFKANKQITISPQEFNSLNDTPLFSDGNVANQKGKKVRKIQIQTTQLETTEENPNGQITIKTQTVENKKQIIESVTDGGDIKKKIIETEKKSQAVENQYNGQTLNMVENYTQKIETQEEKPTGSILHKVETREGKKQALEEEDDGNYEFGEDNLEQEKDQRGEQVNLKFENEEELGTEQKEKILKEMQKRIYGKKDKYTVLLQPSQNASEVD